MKMLLIEKIQKKELGMIGKMIMKKVLEIKIDDKYKLIKYFKYFELEIKLNV